MALAAWAVFEFAMTVRQSFWLGRRPARDPSGWVLGACIGGSIIAALRLGQTAWLPWPGGRLWPVIVGLTEALGDQYERFAAERKRLVPRIW